MKTAYCSEHVQIEYQNSKANQHLLSTHLNFWDQNHIISNSHGKKYGENSITIHYLLRVLSTPPTHKTFQKTEITYKISDI